MGQAMCTPTQELLYATRWSLGAAELRQHVLVGRGRLTARTEKGENKPVKSRTNNTAQVDDGDLEILAATAHHALHAGASSGCQCWKIGIKHLQTCGSAGGWDCEARDGRRAHPGHEGASRQEPEVGA